MGELQGWHADPFGLHEMRYFSAGRPTELVRDGGVEAYDEPPAQGAAATATAADATAATAEVAAGSPQEPSAGSPAGGVPSGATGGYPGGAPSPAGFYPGGTSGPAGFYPGGPGPAVFYAGSPPGGPMPGRSFRLNGLANALPGSPSRKGRPTRWCSAVRCRA